MGQAARQQIIAGGIENDDVGSSRIAVEAGEHLVEFEVSDCRSAIVSSLASTGIRWLVSSDLQALARIEQHRNLGRDGVAHKLVKQLLHGVVVDIEAHRHRKADRFQGAGDQLGIVGPLGSNLALT